MAKNFLLIFPILYLFCFYVFPSIFYGFLKFVVAIFTRIMIYNPPISPVFPEGPFKEYILKEDEYDAIIVGAGPAGSCAAFYCAQAGLKVMTIEKNSFPHKKNCGSCLTYPALQILKDMKLLENFEKENQIKYLQNCVLVSPAGFEYAGSSIDVVGENLAGTIKREILDEKLARAAEEMGADLIEGVEVQETNFNQEKSMWSVVCSNETSYIGRVLILADGAESKIGTKLGLVNATPKAICSHMTIEPKTHNTPVDSVVAYTPYTVPGFVAINKNSGDELNFCHYLAACGEDEVHIGNINPSDMPAVHEFSSKVDPFVSPLVGTQAVSSTPTFTRMRTGSQGVDSSYGNHFLIIGDAAGFADPLTGLGIQNAMLSGRDAALTMIDMYEEGDYSEKSTRQFEERWVNSFGKEFEISKAGVDLIWNNPSAVDAAVEEMKTRGRSFFVLWSKIMTQYQDRVTVVTPALINTLIKRMIVMSIKKKVLKRFYKNHFNYKGKPTGPFR